MKIVFLPETKHNLRWFKTYYIRAFPQGAGRAERSFAAALALLRERPEAGPPLAEAPLLRALRIHRTPFTFLYRIAPGRIEIVRVVDERADWKP